MTSKVTQNLSLGQEVSAEEVAVDRVVGGGGDGRGGEVSEGEEHSLCDERSEWCEQFGHIPTRRVAAKLTLSADMHTLPLWLISSQLKVITLCSPSLVFLTLFTSNFLVKVSPAKAGQW